MNKNDLKDRTKRFAINTILFVKDLPKSKSNNVVSYQLLKSATSSAANYRASLWGRSSADFISKLNITLEEADESMFWFEILQGTNTGLNGTVMNSLYKESNELTAVFAASVHTARKKSKI
jgi:four helix bundle protein